MLTLLGAGAARGGGDGVCVRLSRKTNVSSLRRPQSRRDYPLNLSILLSGGKETN